MNPGKKNPLGRGLESLIPRTESIHNDAQSRGRLLDIDVTDIQPNDLQPRQDFDKEAMEALTASIKSKGVMQPVVVTRKGGKFMLISGERRWRATALAGLKKIPAVVIEEPAENDRLELALIENTQRDDLKPLELARAYKTLMARCGYRQEDVAVIAGKSRSAVANTMRLLDLPETVADALEKKLITEGHARVFLTLDEAVAGRLLKAVIDKSLSVRQTEALARQLNHKEAIAEKVDTDPNIESILKEMEDFFGSKVSLKPTGKGKRSGVIEIRYGSEEELDKIVSKLRGEIC